MGKIDGDNYSSVKDTKFKLHRPNYTWRVWLTDNTYWVVEKAPNAFHRKMQELMFGIKWEKI